MSTILLAVWLAGSVPTAEAVVDRRVDAFVPMPSGPGWTVMDPALAYGTWRTIEYLRRAIDAVHEDLPGGHPLCIGHISARHGGYLWPHISHRTGRDVDIGYFYSDEEPRWQPVTARNLDRARTWALLRVLITETPVRYIFIDTSVQQLLEPYAHAIGEDAAWLDTIFQLGHRRRTLPIILHVPGHDDHIHVRFRGR